jgi:threonine/homoserine/homoserine lactone efflux protein
MPDAHLLGLFVAATVVLLITPGPAVLYIVARSVAQGRAAGLVSVVGIHLATMVHVAAAALGLSALLVSSALAFAVVKYLGAAYLVWIGLRTLLAKDPPEAAPEMPADSLSRVFRDGFVVNLFNPKTALFFLAFLPQFVDPARGDVHWQIMLLGGIFIGLGLLSDSSFALAAGTAGAWLKRSRRYQRIQRWFSGTSFIGLGLTAALADRK